MVHNTPLSELLWPILHTDFCLHQVNGIVTLVPPSQSLEPSVSAEHVTCWNVPLFNNMSMIGHFLQPCYSWLLPSLKQRELILLLKALTTNEQILHKIFLQATLNHRISLATSEMASLASVVHYQCCPPYFSFCLARP